MFKIGIYGSSVNLPEEYTERVLELGRILANYKEEVLIITGACPGVPLQVAKTAHQLGSRIWGFSPVTNISRHTREFPDDDPSIYEKIYYISNDYKYSHNIHVCNEYRNLSSTAFVDAGIIVAGRWGTLNEFSNLVEMLKPVGIFLGTGDLADSLEYLTSRIFKEEQGKLIMDRDPQSLVEKILTVLRDGA